MGVRSGVGGPSGARLPGGAGPPAEPDSPVELEAPVEPDFQVKDCIALSVGVLFPKGLWASVNVLFLLDTQVINGHTLILMITRINKGVNNRK